MEEVLGLFVGVMERRLDVDDAKVEIMITTAAAAAREKDQKKGEVANQECKIEQDVQESMCKYESRGNEEEEDKEGKREGNDNADNGNGDKGNGDNGNGDNCIGDDSNGDEDEEPPAVRLHPAGLKCLWMSMVI